MIPKCSIIIRSFNEEKHIGRLLEGICKQTLYSQLELILVDSGSTDLTAEIARNAGVKVVNIKPEDFSFGRALNIGCQAASGKYLLFASAHVYPLYTDWVEKMIAPFEKERVALVYGRQVGNEITKYSEEQLFKKWFPSVSNYDQRIPFCNNANAVIRKSLWEEQPYDEQLTGLEDLDWATRIMKKGYSVAYESSATIVHVHEESVSRIRNRYRREAIALKNIYPNERFTFFSFIRLSVGNVWADSIHALHDGKFFKELNSIVAFRVLQFWGTYQGYRQKFQPDETLRMRFYYPNDFKDKLFKKKEQNTSNELGEKIIYSS
ncbi:glycosyltransferase family 2 protein [Mucilaginibacter sp. X5P1]|uniref:glycosyltransferase family 2 protein n=1 Tax=Mucilaginibacter sp. X5P1 TaxID=2723088 RepID=UPI00160C734A|nr:glycosyltransferase family A protein [Mucilaginibacter sp. X5P1]MBB6141210.1 glycosyltransferase involved in cell wall biosynthesis [Mucilaginibacter sp. X5P1]